MVARRSQPDFQVKPSPFLTSGPLRTGSFVLAQMCRANLSHIKPDLYTKIVLTVIALALVLIACNQFLGRP
jgi:hypothetical protein